MKNKQRTVAAIRSAMRITIAQIAISALFVTTLYAKESNGQATLDKSFTVYVDKVPLTSLITSVQKQTGVKFSFSPSAINMERIVSYYALEKKLGDFLDDLLKNYSIGNQVIENQITLFPARKEELALLPPAAGILNQERIVTGIVTSDKGDPLEGVTVSEKGKLNAVTTNDKGRYTIRVTDDKAVLVFSIIGYGNGELAVAGASSGNITLTTTNKALEEVVVIGYGAQKKTTVTGSISTVTGKEILKSPVSNVTNSLVGRLTGVSVVQRSGAPGQNTGTINIRGAATYNNSGAIIVVDGIERSSFGDIDPNEIETITVLKDAASTAVFGIRGANGVIVVTTKAGREGKPRVSYTGNLSFQSYTGIPKTLNAYDNARLMNEAMANDGVSPQWNNEELQKLKDGSDPLGYPDINWFDYLTRKTYPQTQHNVSVSGGTKMVKYFTSVGYLFEDGIFKKFDSPYGFSSTPSYTRYNFRSNVDFNLNKNFHIGVKLGGRLQKRYQPSGLAANSFSYDNLEAMISRIIQTPSFAYPVTLPDGRIAQNSDVGTNIWNPYAVITRWGTRNDDNNNIESTFNLDYKLDAITKGLAFKTVYGYDSYFTSITRRNATWAAYTINRQTKEISLSSDRPRDEPLSGLITSYDGNIAANLQTGFNYDRTFNGHSFTGLVLYTRQLLRLNGTNFNAAPRASQGVVGRVTYNYQGKYFAEFNAAYNGSENFAPGYQYGFFPAISAGWTLTNEPFLEHISWLNNLKIRGSYGVVGNDKLDDRFLFLDNYSVSSTGTLGNYSRPNSNVQFGLPTSLVTYNVAYQSAFGQPLITWETGTKRNIGLEASLFDKKLNLVVDLFDERRKDILTDRSNTNITSGPLLYGQQYPSLNIGEVYNKGYEIEVKYEETRGKFTYGLNAQLSYARNKVISRDEPKGLPSYLKQEGKPVGQFFGYLTNGFYQSAQDIEASPANTLGKVIPGDLKFQDYNKDGVINSDDRVAIGHSRVPEYIFSLSPSLTWNGFTLSVMFQGVTNVSSDVILTEQNNGMQMYEHLLGRWTPATANTATWPALHNRGNTYVNYTLNDFVLQDASYIKLRNAELSWNLPRQWAERLTLGSVRLYVSGQNLHTWTKFKMYLDPENINVTNTDFSKQSIYPVSRIYNVGLNVQF